jgi:aspartate/tyrosine/aromatic aminotransferase
MFESLPVAPPDSILGLTDAFQKDQRTDKVNLTVGVYKDEAGQTPVLASVKKAEQRLWNEEKTKGYLGIDGLTDFNRLVQELVFGDSVDAKRVAAVQSPGGTGALRVVADTIGSHYRGGTVWLTQPTWPNHPSIFQAASLQTRYCPYLDATKTGLDLDAMLQSLQQEARPGDIVCLHGCCHNPTGIDPTAAQWDRIAEQTAKLGMLPLVDFAYQGFGDGLAADRVGLIALLKHHAEVVVCASFSKNFGLYSERVGAAMIVARDPGSATATLSQMKLAVRANYSNPPRHGGAIVATILGDESLRSLWESEVDQMRGRISSMRTALVQGMRDAGSTRDFSFLLDQKGMFSYTGLNAMQADWLKSQKGIYLVGTGRINVAGLTPRNLPGVCQAITECLESTISS